MPTISYRNKTFDARPDRIDYRDRPYQPMLRCLPPQFPSKSDIDNFLSGYLNAGLILNQGNEGSCTGFGLAATINYLLWKNDIENNKVSERMLYNTAKLYDEWPGDDYEGSSCRGAMKGWHRHGVCAQEFWPYEPNAQTKPRQGWLQDAAKRPLGAYYRVNKDSIADMQAAIVEVGAVYVSGIVHDGWFLGEEFKLPVIPFRNKPVGGHAFALVGYTSDGFIVQNSWSASWGYNGFAVLSYSDWVQNSSDAWVAVLGAPMAKTASRTVVSASLASAVDEKSQWLAGAKKSSKQFSYQNENVMPLSEGSGYEHTIVLGNNGKVINKFIDSATADDAVEIAAISLPLERLKKQTAPKLAIYAHGGLNSEQDSMKRICVMAPYFLENGIYPLFITWKTGYVESLSYIIGDSVAKQFTSMGHEPSRGWLSDMFEKISEKKDRWIESACEDILAKPIWSQIKQNAEASANQDGGIALLSAKLTELHRQIPGLEIHVVGHSAGSIILGHLLDCFADKNLKVSTATLFAPACTVEFALDKYLAAFNSGVLNPTSLHVDVLTDKRELDDNVGPYGKSLLYLVSRALEDVHKMPLLGMEKAWDKTAHSDEIWNKNMLGQLAAWREAVQLGIALKTHGKSTVKTSIANDVIKNAHGAFDNDIEVMTSMLERIKGGALTVEVENLQGF